MKMRITILLVALTAILVGCHLASGNPDTAPTFGAIQNITWAGDLDGSTMVNQEVTGLEHKPLPPLAVGALSYDGGSWYFGSSGGSVAPGSAGQALFTNDAGAATVWTYPHGDVDASSTDPGALTVNAIQGFGVSTSSPTTGNTLHWGGANWSPAALNLAGGSNYVTGALPTANQVAQAMGGDAVGTTSATYIASLSGNSSATAPVNLTGTYLGVAGATTYGTLGQIRTSDFGGSGVDVIGLYTPSTTYVAMAWAAPQLNIGGDFNQGHQVSQTLINGATLVGLYTNAGYSLATNNSGNLFFGANGSGAPLVVDWSTATTPILHSGTSATSFTAGTGKSGAAFQLQGDNAANVLKLTTAGEMQTYLDVDQVSAPSVPSSSQRRVYVDSADGRLKVKDNLGNITVLTP